MNIPELVSAVLAWAEARNLIKGSDPKSQTLKTVSEFGEIAAAINEGNTEEVFDGIGDVLVTCIIVSRQLGVNDDTIAGIIVAADFDSRKIQKDGLLFTYADAAAALGLMADNVLKAQVEQYGQNMRAMATNLSALAGDYGSDLNASLEGSYEAIKDRKGVMYNGAFVKDSDPRYEGIMAELATPGADSAS
jgi:hypothetical protein